MFLSKNIIADINKHLDFGEPCKIGVNEKDYAELVYRGLVNNLFITQLIITFNRCKEVPTSLVDELIPVENYKCVDEANEIILIKITDQHDMVRHNSDFGIKLNQRDMAFMKSITINQDFKAGIDTEETFKSVSSKSDKDILKNDDLFAEDAYDMRSHINDDLSVKINTKDLYMEDIIGLDTIVAEIIVDEITAIDTSTNDLVILKDASNIEKRDTELHYENAGEFAEPKDLELNGYDNGDGIYNPTKGTDLNNSFEQIYNDTPNINIFEWAIAYLKDRELNNIDDSISINISDKGVVGDDNFILIGIPSKGVDENQYVGIDIPMKGIFSYGNEFINKPSIAIEDDQKIEYIGKTSTGVMWQDDALHVSKDDNGAFDSDGQVSTSKTETGVFSTDETLNISKFSSEITYDHMLVNLHHMPRQLTDVEANVFFMQKNSNTIFTTEDTTVDKYHKTIDTKDEVQAERIDDYGIEIKDVCFAEKHKKGIYTSEYVFVFKDLRKDTSSDDHEFVAKRTHGIHSDDGLIVNRASDFGILVQDISQLAKSNKDAFTSDTYEYVSKTEYNIFNIDDYLYTSKAEYDGYDVGEVVNVSKAYVCTSATDYSEKLGKVMRAIGSDAESPFANKNYRPTDIEAIADFISKAYKDTSIVDISKWIKVPSRPIGFLDTSVFVIPMEYEIDNDENINIIPRYRNTGVEDIFINFTRYYNFSYNESLSAKRPQRFSSRVYDNDTAKRNITNDARVNETIGVTCDPYETLIEESGDSFAYTDKPDYTLIKDDRIDELQLPPTDFNYSTFAKKLLGDDGQINRKYIKKYDDETGNPIVTLPIENPIKHFSDLAVHYLDLNVGMLTYIIEKAYNIWQNNIFVYSAMSSNGALNDILIKLKQGLFIQYPSEKDQEHLHRAIRLFRWYAEMSILNNAEYMVKLTYKDLSVDYANKNLTDFSTISTISNMQIDNTYVLSPIDKNAPSEIRIMLDRSHKTRLVFDLATSGGNCDIVINGNTKRYSDQFIKIDEEIPVGENEIVIKFTPGTSPLFNIMQLAIKQYAIKSYKVSYIGKIGETNPTVNHLITMLSVCGDSIDDIQRTVAHSMPTVQALDQLRVYFNLHHEDKLKGKRLITKH